MAKTRETLDPEKLIKKPKKPSGTNGVVIEGIDNILVKFAKCCNPLPGDRIVGFITRGSGASIHRADCPNVARGMGDGDSEGRWVKAYWADTRHQTFDVPLVVEIKTRVGAISDIISVFTNMHINVGKLNGRDMEDGISRYNIEAGVNSIEQLDLLMNRIRKVSGVSDVQRTHE